MKEAPLRAVAQPSLEIVVVISGYISMSNVYSGKDLLLNVKGSVSVIFCFIFRVSDSADLLFLLYTLIEISFCHTAGKFLILLFISVVNCRDLFGYSIGVLYSIGF